MPDTPHQGTQILQDVLDERDTLVVLCKSNANTSIRIMGKLNIDLRHQNNTEVLRDSSTLVFQRGELVDV